MKALIDYMRLCVMNTQGAEQDKCIEILNILEKKRNRKNTILKAITAIVAIVFWISLIVFAFAGNSLSCIAMIVCYLWLLLFCIAN